MKKLFLFFLLAFIGIPLSKAQKIFQEGKLYGIKDDDGKVVVEAKHQRIYFSENGFLLKEGKYWGILGRDYKWSVKPKKYIEAEVIASNDSFGDTDDPFSEGEPELVALKLEGGGYQFTNFYWFDIFPKKPVEEYTTVASEEGRIDRLIAKYKGKYGVLYTPEPYWAVSPKYQSIQVINDDTFLGKVSDGQWVIVDSEDQEIVSLKSAEIKILEGQLMLQKEGSQYAIYEYNVEGEEPINRLEGILIDSLKKTEYGFLLYSNGKQGLYSLDLQQILPIAYDRIALREPWGSNFGDFDDFGMDETVDMSTRRDENGKLQFTIPHLYLYQNGKKGLMLYKNNQWTTLMPTQYKDFEILKWGGKQKLVALQNSSGKWALVLGENIDFNAEIEFPFDKLVLQGYDTDKNGYYIAVKNGMYGLVEHGKNKFLRVKDKEFDELQYTSDHYVYTGKKNGQKVVVFCDKLTSQESFVTDYDHYYEVIPYEEMKMNQASSYEKFFMIKQNQKWGLFDYYGQPIIPVKYDSLIESQKYVYRVQDNGKWGIVEVTTDPFQAINEQYSFIETMPATYTGIENFKNTGLYLLEKDGMKGLCKLDGDIFLPVEYSNIEYRYGHKYGSHTEPPSIVLSKNGKSGIKRLKITYQLEIPSQWELQEFIPVEMDSIRRYLYPSYWIPLQKNGKWGLIDSQGKSLVPHEYDQIYGDYRTLRVKKGGKWGAYSIKKLERDLYELGELMLPVEYDSLYYQSGMQDYIFTRKNGKEGIVGLEEGLKSWKPEYAWLRYANDSTLIAKKGKETGRLDLISGVFTAGKSVETLLKLKWKTEIGKTVFRSNPMLANGQIVIGSNGRERNQADDKDGICLINSKTGAVNLLIRPETTGKIDVNGQAIEGNRIYFGNENGNAFCYDFSGKQLWKQKLEGEIENSPALADFTQDGQLDAVFATDAGKVFALDGKNGKILWSWANEGFGYFSATPTCYDVSADGVADVIVGLGGKGDLLAFDGRNGNVLWNNDRNSGIHNPVSMVKDESGRAMIAYAPSYGGIIFTDLQGEIQFVISSEIGNFAKPLLLPNGLISVASTWWDGESDDVASYQTQSTAGWEFESYWKYFQLKEEAQIFKGSTFSVSSTGIAADIMGDEKLEIVWVSEAGDCWILNESGQLVERLVMPIGAEAPLYIGDIDEDGKLEMLVASLDGYLYCYETPKAGKVVHQQFMGNNQNTGVISFPKVVLPSKE